MTRGPARYWYTMELLRDLSEDDPDRFHRFMWENHLGYAETYEISTRFGNENLVLSRRLLVRDVARFLERESTGLDADEVRSVLEVGCSLGYLLRHLERTLFSNATTLEGIDVDARAVRRGSRHLDELGSRVRLRRHEIDELDSVFESRRFDVVLCAGVLLYLTEERAAAAVRSMMERTDHLLVLTGPAAPDRDNRTLGRSRTRDRDGTWIHNLDAMVEEAGGSVVWRRWEGPRELDHNSIYFVFAVPGAGGDP